MALRKKSTYKLNNKVLDFFFNPTALPYTISFITLSVMFVGFRMKGIEQAYEQNKLKSHIEKELMRNKELKAQRANEMSVPKLREFAVKYGLKEPGPEQIIFIP
jgi:cell division protein FtsL